MADPSPTTEELAALLVTVITGVEGGSDEHWAKLIGAIQRLPIIENIRSNWAVKATGGSRRERTVIAQAADIVRHAHPYVRG